MIALDVDELETMRDNTLQMIEDLEEVGISTLDTTMPLEWGRVLLDALDDSKRCARVVAEATELTSGWIRTAVVDIEQAFEEHGYGWVEKSKPFRKAMLKLADLLEEEPQ